MKIVKKTRLIIHAPNIHIGGGAILLTALLSVLAKQSQDIVVILDQRYQKSISSDSIQFQIFPASLTGRLQAELFLYKLAAPNDIVVCFGNLPPLFKLPCMVYLILQNRNLLGLNTLRQFPWKVACRIFIERQWLRGLKSHINAVIVQTPTMQQNTRHYLGDNVPIIPYPWVAETNIYQKRSLSPTVVYDFIYVSTADAHKNHRRLIEAWCLLAEQEVFPHLALTIDEEKSPELWEWIALKIKEYHLKITNLGHVPHAAVIELYPQAKALIFPSTSEAFGLPLLEARQAGISVLAGELDYVRDLLDPEESFDPYSAVSISRAVLRYLEKPQASLVLRTPHEFIEFLFQYNNELPKREIVCES